VAYRFDSAGRLLLVGHVSRDERPTKADSGGSQRAHRHNRGCNGCLVIECPPPINNWPAPPGALGLPDACHAVADGCLVLVRPDLQPNAAVAEVMDLTLGRAERVEVEP